MSQENIKVEDSFITIGDMELVDILKNNYKLFIDDSTGGDTKAAYVSVLKEYLINDVKPSIDEDSGTWHIGNTDTEVPATSSGVSKVLWEGIAATDSRNFLSESINNFKFLEIQWKTNLKSGSYRVGRPLFLEVSDIEYRTTLEPDVVPSGESTYIMSETLTNDGENTIQMHISIQFGFFDDLSFVILSPIRHYGWNMPANITKIIGIK